VDQIQSKGGKATAAVLDLNSLESAMALSKYLSTEFPNINYFFANAGTTPQYNLTVEGFENAFGSQYLAHMAVGEFMLIRSI
jgi:short-subunit dehydrogenase involved in D-alanine esterification of teichoic acids